MRNAVEVFRCLATTVTGQRTTHHTTALLQVIDHETLPESPYLQTNVQVACASVPSHSTIVSHLTGLQDAGVCQPLQYCMIMTAVAVMP